MAKKKSSIRKAVKPAAEEVKKAEVAVEVKTEPEVLAEPVKEEVKAEPAAEVKEEKKPAPKKKCAPKKKAEPVKEEVKAEPAPAAAEPAAEVKEEPKEEKKAAPKKKCAPRKKKEEVKAEPAVEEVPVTEPAAAEEPAPVAEEAAPAVEETAVPEEAPVVEEVKEEYYSPRRSIAFIGSECYPFVKTGGLGDVMYALPKELGKQNCDVRVILPRYTCSKQQWQEKMGYRGAFQMDLCSDGRSYYVGIMEYIEDGVVYDFIDNEEFFSNGNPYTTIVDDIPKFCYFSKAAIAALNYMNWVPNIIHCHDWQAALVPVFLRTLFAETPCGQARTILTIHNLRFQGIYDIPTIKYWTGLPGYCFNDAVLKEGRRDANMLKGGIAYCDAITTVSNTYAYEIQTPYYGENLDGHLRYHSYKLRGIVNGIDYDIWNPETDKHLPVGYNKDNFLENKRACKKALQEELGLEVNDGKYVIGLVSRLTDQKGLDLVNAIVPSIMDGNTQMVVLGTGDRRYEDSFRYYEHAYKGQFCANIMYDETRSHKIYAGCDAFLVPSQFEPCGLTQLIAMHYGTVPIVRETGGLKDTVEPYNQYYNWGNGFTFDRYDAGLLLDAINRSKTFFFTDRYHFDEMVRRDMEKDVSWTVSAKQYKDLYLELTQW